MTSPLPYILTLALVTPLAAMAEGDADRGEKVFRKCKACHEIGADAKSKTGPVLTGILGAPAAHVEGFDYSDALKQAAEGGLVWDEASLAQFLAKPREFLKGTRMSFAGLRKEEEIADLIAYLAAN